MTGRDEHPAWCTREDENSPAGQLQHRSQRIRVGQRRPGRLTDRGQVTAWLTVNAAHMAGVTVDISLEQAAEFSDGIVGLLRAAGREHIG